MKYFFVADTVCSGDITTCCGDYAIAKYLVIVKNVLGIIHFVVPIILIIMSTIGLIKLMLNPDDPQKKNWRSLINKFIAAVIIFFIPKIVSIIFSLMPNSFNISGCFNNAESTKQVMDNTTPYNAIDETKTTDEASKSSNYIIKSDNTKRMASSKTTVKTAKRNSAKKSESKKAKSNSKKGKDIVRYARRFIGNPYVYGGTSLTNGADCSGFVMKVYAHFGIRLNRTAAAQSTQGKKVSSINNAQAGDLFFYRDKSGRIGHVAMYEGNGRIVHASNSRVGIIESSANYRKVSIIKRYI